MSKKRCRRKDVEEKMSKKKCRRCNCKLNYKLTFKIQILLLLRLTHWQINLIGSQIVNKIGSKCIFILLIKILG